ncbi:MAG: hypothetical protein WC437_05600 [Patescibacteria group bacterium]
MDKEEAILKELKKRCEETRFGTLKVEFKIQDGKILAGEIVEQRIKLG